MNLPKLLCYIFIVPLLNACADNPDLLDAAVRIAQQSTRTSGPLSQGDIRAGLKEALRVSADQVVSQLGVTNGFNADPQIHIPLPDSLRKIRNVAARLGMKRSFDDLETRLNRAAEAATPQARQLFQDAILKMTLADARSILSGPDDAATQYFQRTMSQPLSEKMKPIVDQAVSSVGVVQSYNNAVSRLGPLAPALPNYKQLLIDHVVKRGMDGIFHYMAQEEAAIRHDPAKRITELLRKVFGGA